MTRLLIAAILLCSSAFAQSNVAVWGVTYTPLTASQPTVDNGSATYNNDVTITVTNEPSGGATCYTYSTDGSTPADPTAATAGTCDDNTYNSSSKPVVTITGTKYKFMNTKSGETNSTVLGPLTYTLTVSDPTFTTAAPYSGSAITGFSITPVTTGSSIRYSTDGSTPACPSTGLTTLPFDINTTETVKAISCKTDYNPSNVISGTYTISGTPTITYVDGKYCNVDSSAQYCNTASISVTAGDLIVARCSNVSTTGTCLVTDTQSNTYTIQIALLNGDNSFGHAQISTATAGSTGSMTVRCTESVTATAEKSCAVAVFHSTGVGGWTLDKTGTKAAVDGSGGAARTTTAALSLDSGAVAVFCSEYDDRDATPFGVASTGFTAVGTNQGDGAGYAAYKIVTGGGTTSGSTTGGIAHYIYQCVSMKAN